MNGNAFGIHFTDLLNSISEAFRGICRESGDKIGIDMTEAQIPCKLKGRNKLFRCMFSANDLIA